MPAPVIEEFFDPQYMRTRFALRWEAPSGRKYQVSMIVSEELLYYNPQVKSDVIDRLMRQMEDYLELHDFEDYVRWGDQLKKLTYQQEIALKFAELKYAQYPTPPVDTYRENAASEFEGVEELDPELWKGDNGFT